jgi:hypothetical protein
VVAERRHAQQAHPSPVVVKRSSTPTLTTKYADGHSPRGDVAGKTIHVRAGAERGVESIHQEVRRDGVTTETTVEYISGESDNRSPRSVVTTETFADGPADRPDRVRWSSRGEDTSRRRISSGLLTDFHGQDGFRQRIRESLMEVQNDSLERECRDHEHEGRRTSDRPFTGTVLADAEARDREREFGRRRERERLG